MKTEPHFTFGVIADVQYCDAAPAYGRYFRASTRKLAEALQVFAQQPLSFILDLGDLIDRDFASYDPVLKLYHEARVPVHFTLGNHDYSVAPDKKSEVAGMAGHHPEGYCDFVFQHWRFIILNGNELSLFATPQGATEEREALAMLRDLRERDAENAMDWNGGISRRQKGWLREKLEAAQQLGQKVIVAGHYPLYPKGSHNLWNDEEIVNLLANFSQVAAYFNGHQHQGNYGRKDHIHYLNFKGMVETETENAFAIVKVYEDRMEVQGYGREEDRILRFA